jgi:hypothetical protein
MLKIPRLNVAEAGGDQVVVPATPTGADQRPRALEAVCGREFSDGLGAGGAVDVQDVEAMPGGQADVGLGVAGPPGQDRARLQVASLTPWGTRLPRGCLPTWLQLGSRHEQATLATAGWG